MFKVNNRDTEARCEICSKSTIKKPKLGQLLRSGVFITNFEHISHLVLVFILAGWVIYPTMIFYKLFEIESFNYK